VDGFEGIQHGTQQLEKDTVLPKLKEAGDSATPAAKALSDQETMLVVGSTTDGGPMATIEGVAKAVAEGSEDSDDFEDDALYWRSVPATPSQTQSGTTRLTSPRGEIFQTDLSSSICCIDDGKHRLSYRW
jgi:hypothetical protein